MDRMCFCEWCGIGAARRARPLFSSMDSPARDRRRRQSVDAARAAIDFCAKTQEAAPAGWFGTIDLLTLNKTQRFFFLGCWK